MARAIWSGVISFGMVSIPVKLYPATESKDISFDLLHKECHNRVKQLRWRPFHDEQVEWNDTERGYEYAKGQYVVLTDEDFEKLPLPSKHTIDLSSFVKAEEIDPMYYEKAYYLEPEGDLGQAIQPAGAGPDRQGTDGGSQNRNSAEGTPLRASGPGWRARS